MAGGFCGARWLAVAVLLAGCHPASAPGAAAGGPGAKHPMPVKLETLQLQPVQESSEYLATLTSRRSVAIRPQVSGPITKIHVQPGQRVAAGAPLMDINPQRDAATLANLRAVRAQRQAQADLARQNFTRAKQLFHGGAISREEYENAVSANASAAAELQAAQAQIAAQQTQLQYDHVSAPFAGVVGDVPVKVGDSVTPQTTLTTLDESEDLQAYVHVPLDRAKDLTPQTLVQLLDANGNAIAQQQVGFVSPEADPATQTLLVRIDFSNREELRAAQLVRARVIWSTHPGLLIPADAVQRLSGATFAFVAVPGDGGLSAQQVPVKLGDLVGDRYVVLDGLQPGQQVVVSGVQNLMQGAPLMPEPPRQARPAPPATRPGP